MILTGWKMCKFKQKLLNILHHRQKKKKLCVYTKMNIFALFTTEEWRKNCVEAKEYAGEICINQKHLQEKIDIANISEKTQYYSSEL